MVKFRNHTVAILAGLVMVGVASFLIGCAERDEVTTPENTDASFQKAAAALNLAQEAMKKAGIDINFSDIGTLGELVSILPNPLGLSAPEKQQAIQDAIGAMYGVLDAYGQRIAVAQAPARPAQTELKISDSDLLMVHFHLAYLYVLEAVGILAREGNDLFEISFPEAVQIKNLEEVYKFKLTERGQARFDEIAKRPSSRPKDYLKEFSAGQRQAILDALVLLLGARVKVSAFPGVNDVDGQPITAQTPKVDRTICRQDALFHLEKGLESANVIAPDLADAVDEFNKIIAQAFTEDFLDQTSQWGFEIENEQELLNRINQLTRNIVPK
ncbi:hypothetical protein HYR99_24635 [Candidatus Poribacteria bacterium]|nr:hypothetical protein [Candidatus Poribacteria bacterium]